MINYFLNLSKAEKLFLLIAAIVFFYLVRESFVFSANYDVQSWRGIDDIAFQHTIRSFLPNLFHGSHNDYGYGWLFWITNAIASYPGYILHLFGYDRLLIASPRLLSLVLSFGGIYFFYRILSYYCQNSWINVCAGLLLLSYPAFGFYATYFGTAAHVFFYSILTFYLVLCKDITQLANQKKAAIAMAACGAVKLTGFLIAPMVGLIFLDKNIRAGTLTAKSFFKLAGFFFIILIFFINPRLFLSPFIPSYLYKYLGTMYFYLHQVATAPADPTPWYVHAKNDLIVFSLSVPVYLFVFLSLCIYSLINRKNRPEFLYIVIGYIIAAGYLLLFVKEGGTYITLYSHSINWVPLLGLLLYAQIRHGILVPLALVILNFILNHQRIILTDPKDDQSWLAYNEFSHRRLILAEQMKLQKEMINIIQANNKDITDEPIRILLVYPAPTAFSTFDPHYDVEYMFDQSIIHLDKPFHYVILSFDSSILDPKQRQQMVLQHDEITKRYFDNKQILDRLISLNKLGEGKCKQLYQNGKIKLFKCNYQK